MIPTHMQLDTLWDKGIRRDIARILFTRTQIHERTIELGQQLTQDYANSNLLVVGILNGSFPFIADLVRTMNMPLDIDFMAVSSYGERTKSSGVVRTLKDLNQSIAHRDVLLVEDIVDTGLTVNYLLENLHTRKPNSIKVCTLLDKREARLVPLQADYVGFSCPNEFVVGYGLDYRGFYRNLPFVGVLKPEIYQTQA